MYISLYPSIYLSIYPSFIHPSPPNSILTNKNIKAGKDELVLSIFGVSVKNCIPRYEVTETLATNLRVGILVAITAGKGDGGLPWEWKAILLFR